MNDPSTIERASATASMGSPAQSQPDAGGDDALSSLMGRFLVSMLALAGAPAGAVRVLTDDGAQMRLVAQVGLPEALLASEVLVDRQCGVCGVAITSESLQWVDAQRPCSLHQSGEPFGLAARRILAMPLQYGGQVLGVYNLFFDTDAGISAETSAVLELIGQLLGQALYNARVERERLRMTVMHERQALVHEVHDAIAQTLVYVKMRLPLLRDAMLAHDDQRSLKYLSDVNLSVTEVHDNLREVMTFFRTRMDPLGLLHAIQDIAAVFHDRTGIRLDFENAAGPLHLSDAQEVQVFHIVQEALANVAKHSSARRARLLIRRVTGELEVLIEDDGSGMAPQAGEPVVMAGVAAGHFGMDIMKGRAERLGGTIAVSRNEGGGTRVRLRVPATARKAST